MSCMLYFSLWDSWSLRWPSQLLSREASPGTSAIILIIYASAARIPPYSMFENTCNSFHFSFWPVVVPSPSQAPGVPLCQPTLCFHQSWPWSEFAPELSVKAVTSLPITTTHAVFHDFSSGPLMQAIKHMPAHTHTFTRMDISHSSGTEMTCFHLSYLIGSVYSTGFFDLATMCCFISTIDLKNRAILINRCFASLRNVGLLHVCLCSK